MEWVETTGRTVEEAKDAALDQLGVDEQDAEFEVLEEPRMGLFGRLRAEARVRARVRPNRLRPKEDRRDRRRRTKGSGLSDAAGAAGAGWDEAAAPRVAPTPAPTPDTESDAPGAEPSLPHLEGAKMDQDVPLFEQAEVARDFLVGLLDAFGVAAGVQTHDAGDDTFEVSVSGDGLGLLIGPQGGTLQAIQEITRTVVQRRTGGRNGRIVVDVAGYRQKRKAALERFTREIAAQVRSSGVSKALEPMHPADRKVVHDTVNELEGVTTSSEGEEPRRRVVISPA